MDYVLLIAIITCIFIILTQSYNLVLGYAGMVHVGHVGFMAIGAYASALVTLSGYSFFAGIISGILAAGVAGVLLALPTVRFRDDYLVAATLGMGEIIRLILLNERELTGGSTGIAFITRPVIFGMLLETRLTQFFFVLFVTASVLLIVWRITSSPFGKVLEAIREDEIACQSLGKKTWLIKVQILTIAAMLAGLAGVLWAHINQFISPNDFNIQYMIYVFLLVVFGGRGTFWGPVISVVILNILFESIKFLETPPAILGPLRWMIYSAVLIAMIMLRPNGLLGERHARRRL